MSRAPLAASILLTLQILWNVQGITQADPRYYFQPIHLMAEGQFIPANLKPISEKLLRSNMDGLYADYWIGENIAFNLDERIPVFSIPYRRVEQARAAMDGVLPAYLLHLNAPDQPVYGRFLSDLGWRREAFFPLLLYLPASPFPLPKSSWKYSVPSGDIYLPYAWDGALETAWTPRPADHSFRLIFPKKIYIQRIAILSSRISTSAPLSIQIGENKKIPS